MYSVLYSLSTTSALNIFFSLVFSQIGPISWESFIWTRVHVFVQQSNKNLAPFFSLTHISTISINTAVSILFLAHFGVILVGWLVGVWGQLMQL